MSLNTLLEAARFIELQEQRQTINRSDTSSSSSSISSSSPTSASISPSSSCSSSETPLPKSTPLATIPLGHTNLTSVVPQFAIKDVRSLAVQPHRASPYGVIHNSFDMINPLVIDEVSGEQKRKQPPMVFRSGTREVHNKLEKHRRAHLKECFDMLKLQLPPSAEKKTSNLGILHSALRHIQMLKRRERDLEHEMERLAREKIASQQRLVTLKKEIAAKYDGLDFSRLLPEIPSTPTLPPPRDPIDSEQPSIVTIPVGKNIVQQQLENNERVPIPPLPRQQQQQPQTVQFLNGTKEQQQVQATTLSVLPMGYPVNQPLVLQKVALVPKGITELSPLVSSPTVAHFITTPQQLNGKVVPLMNVNAQYVMKPVVVVSTASRTS